MLKLCRGWGDVGEDEMWSVEEEGGGVCWRGEPSPVAESETVGCCWCWWVVFSLSGGGDDGSFGKGEILQEMADGGNVNGRGCVGCGEVYARG